MQTQTKATAHIVCAVAENLARETCVASLDAGAPTVLHATKQGNGQTYAETLAYLELLQPDEVLLNEGRQTSQLARKILELYSVTTTTANADNGSAVLRDKTNGRNIAQRRRQRNLWKTGTMASINEDKHYNQSSVEESDEYGDSVRHTRKQVIVKFISRVCFDQTKGAELLRVVAREETYDAKLVEDYILLSSANAVLRYTQQHLGACLTRNSLNLHINAGGNHRMAIDRSTLLQLELLMNAKTGKLKDSLVGSIDCTKTTVGSRLLRTNLMSPPTQIATIHARQELVDTFLGNEAFFYDVMEHLMNLPDVDRMLNHIALVPRLDCKDMGMDGHQRQRPAVSQRLASKGISALVAIKSTLKALPALVQILKNQLESTTGAMRQTEKEISTVQQINSPNDEDDNTTIVTDRSSLLIGLGGCNSSSLHSAHTIESRRYSSHLLRAIIFSLNQPAFNEVHKAILDVFTESTAYTRNPNAMRHQECFALRCESDGMMGILRKAFLANVDDIYRKADEYAEVYGMQVKVKYTASRGYFLAVPSDIGTDLPLVFTQPTLLGRHIHCTTEEIASFNTRAQDNVQDILLMTHDKIQEVLNIGRQYFDAFAALSDAIALLDLCHGFADHVTLSQSPWCRPVLSEKAICSEEGSTDSECTMMIRSGRYAIAIEGHGLESADGSSGYIPNDTFASDAKPFTLITGINGSGKSTYLKQIAICTVLAHCGSYVPAEQACIPIRDLICSRIGNTDDQEHNISTFMLEMKETAFICNHATERSLILIDELGRATSNEDGVAIAWSIAEYLLKKGAMTFFATHYPQLCRLGDVYLKVQNVHLEASVSNGERSQIYYTHRVVSGTCAVSTDYGVELASVCGWPQEVVTAAKTIHKDVESLLPDESICNSEQANHYPFAEAMLAIRTIASQIKGYVAHNKAQPYESIRRELDELHRSCVKYSHKDLAELIERMLISSPSHTQQDSIGIIPSLPVRAPKAALKDRKIQNANMIFTSDRNGSGTFDLPLASTPANGNLEKLGETEDNDNSSLSSSSTSSDSSSSNSSASSVAAFEGSL